MSEQRELGQRGAPRRLAIVGSSGSIGTQTLDVVRAVPGAFEVVALGVSSSVDLLVEQVAEFRPAVVAVADPVRRDEARQRLPGVEVVAELAALVEPADTVLNAVVGFAGLDVTLATLAAGKRLALANKESLIAAGPVVQPLRATPGAELVPVDSEHCALHQCLRSSIDTGREVARLVLTASGGPFRGRTLADLQDITVAEALAHPTWSMGPKITIDSSTLFNKGLEVIEAHELFGVDYDRLDVVVHPQSVVHSMVEYTDGSTIAQLSMPDMRLPIGYALGYPARLAAPYGAIDWSSVGSLGFEAPDTSTFRGLALAYDAGRLGGTAPATLSAANEVAVDAFLAGRLRWADIVAVVEGVLERHESTTPFTAADVVAADRQARRVATEIAAYIHQRR